MPNATVGHNVIIRGVIDTMVRIPMTAGVFVIAGLLTACVSYEGIYTPACAAFAGDRIELHQGQFSWEKFTDSVVVDDDGEVVNQFPDYPKRGSYRIDGPEVSMQASSGELITEMYLLRQDDRRYLLTGDQHRAWERTGQLADCALVLGADGEY